MDATMIADAKRWDADGLAREPRMVSAAEFRELLTSHRRLVRVIPRQEKLRGLQDTETGELFVTDAQRLLHPAHPDFGRARAFGNRK